MTSNVLLFLFFQPCLLPATELGHSFIEFILVFRRTCDKWTWVTKPSLNVTTSDSFLVDNCFIATADVPLLTMNLNAAQTSEMLQSTYSRKTKTVGAALSYTMIPTKPIESVFMAKTVILFIFYTEFAVSLFSYRIGCCTCLFHMLELKKIFWIHRTFKKKSFTKMILYKVQRFRNYHVLLFFSFEALPLSIFWYSRCFTLWLL